MNRKGSAIPAVLMVSSILAITAVALLILMRNSEQYLARQVREERLQDIIRSVGATMEDVMDCTNILGDNTFNNVAPTTEQPVVLRTTYGADALVPANYIQAGKTFGNGLVLSNVTIRAIAASGFSVPVKNDMRFAYSATPISSSESILTKYLAEIKFYPNGIMWNADKPDRKVRIFIKVQNATNRIWSCHGMSSPAESCEIVTGGTYNPYMPISLVDYRCNPDLSCFMLKGPSNGLHTTSVCPTPDLFKAQEIGDMMGVKHYLCNWCNKHRP